MRLRFGAVVCLASVLSGVVQAGPGVVTDLAPIPLHPGANQIPDFAGDGRPGLVVLGWRDNGNAHGYDLALVLLQSPHGGWDVVKIDMAADDRWGEWQDGVRDDPHTGDDAVRSFRFARGRVDGAPATLLLIATRDNGSSIPEPSKVTFQSYRLVHDPDVGTTPDHFVLVHQDRSAKPFCNADMALSNRFGLPLRSSYAGAKTGDGCP